jgi:hypothetical protein
MPRKSGSEMAPDLRALVGHQFHAVERNSEQFYSERFLKALDASGDGRFSLFIRPVERIAESVMHTAWAN